ncbi:MAG: beta-ketoacyl-[acyl-carrier-protein] synthase family protein [Spirochaetales bacterium]|nr:MAG: beta-ketoacyl-[acyl-carrier-protein] synthase family protein [Spirochaetales bacterium]
MSDMKRRVVITGMGTINPLGDSLEKYYNNLLAGKSGVTRWTSIDLSRVECKIGGDLGNYDCLSGLEQFRDDLTPETYKGTRKLFRTATFSAKLGALGAMAAWKNAGLFGQEVDPHRISVMVAGHNLNSNYIFENMKTFLEEPEYLDPLSGIEAIDPNVPAVITEILGIQGPSFTIGGACASGNLALREGFRDIITGECDKSLIVGAPFDVSPPDIQASVIINSVVVKPEYQNAPEKASRPFDTKRCGFVYSHGAGTLVIEELSSALARGAYIWGEVVGVKASANANHLPVPGAEKQVLVMLDLLNSTGVKPEEIDYVNCHATGTPVGDIQEIRALQEVFGSHARKLKLNAPKSMLGHTCWASPIVESIGGLLQMRYGKLHPTINIDELDPEIHMDVCANKTQDHRINMMLKNSFGFGGVNCCSLIKRFEA